jgi:hypothetical protein
MITIKYSKWTPECDAIRETFEYSEIEFDIINDDETVGITMEIIRNGKVETLVAWQPIFLYISRRAHTFPSEPLDAAMVLQWMMMDWGDEKATLRVLEENLQLNTWLGGFDDSTAADFLWQTRLQYISDDLEEYPALREYITRDTKKSYCECDSSESDDDDEAVNFNFKVPVSCVIA